MKNFIDGVSGIFDIFPTISTPQLQQIQPINSSSSDDIKHLSQDWLNIGNDLRKSINGLKKSYIKK